MDINYMKYIQNFLAGLEPLTPVSTGIDPNFGESHPLKAFIFDVYGTLMISASGDIDESLILSVNLRKAMDFSHIRLMGDTVDQERTLNEILDAFIKDIKDFHNRHRTNERPYPEVDIQQIWEIILRQNHDKGKIELNGKTCIRCMTFVFEILSNPLYPMPGMQEVIRGLAARNIPLGIISNAQFYTPVVLNYFLSGRFEEEEVVDYFDPDLTIFSYQYKRSKPDLFLFQLLASSLEKKYGLKPEEVLFIGNDMQKDVYAGHITGFRTALFAGDRKSLRLRENMEVIRNTRPDYIITDLRQLLTLKNQNGNITS
jgi:putative hydrolase of the HAD superfamily